MVQKNLRCVELIIRINMKRFLFFLLLSIPFIAKAYDIEVDGIYYNFTSDSTVSVTYYNIDFNDNYRGNMVIPACINYMGKKYRVTTIGERAFFRSPIKSLIIPSSVVTIEPQALAKTYLISVEIPEGVKELPEALFMGSVFLKSIVIPSSVTAIDGHFIWNCYRLEEIICKSRIPPTFVKNPLDGIMPGLKIVLKVPKGTVNFYKNAEGWKDLEIVEEKKDTRPSSFATRKA